VILPLSQLAGIQVRIISPDRKLSKLREYGLPAFMKKAQARGKVFGMPSLFTTSPAGSG
jgi:hypothetical protein